MIKDVMVRLDGTSGDDVRLAAVNEIADTFDSHVTGLFFNLSPSVIPDGFNDVGAVQVTKAEALMGTDAVHHLRHHGIQAVKYCAIGEEDEAPDALIQECRKLDANLL
jgi:hypothetical protein